MTRRLLLALCGAVLIAGGTAAIAAPKSDTEMAERYLKAAQAGDDQAQFYLGALYSSGTGLSQSDREACKWITSAAEQGHSQAMLVLAALLAIGRGTAKDEVASYRWAYIVAEGSRVYEFKNGAQQLLSHLETKITPGQINQAKSDAERFRQSKPQSPGTSSPANNASSSSPSPPYRTPDLSSPSRPANDPAPSPAVTSKGPQRTPAADSQSGPTARAAPSKSDRNADIDKMLEMVPPGMLKRYGF